MIVKLVRANQQHVFTWDVNGAHIHNTVGRTEETLTLTESIHDPKDVTFDLVEGDQIFFMNNEGQTIDRHTTRLCRDPKASSSSVLGQLSQ